MVIASPGFAFSNLRARLLYVKSESIITIFVILGDLLRLVSRTSEKGLLWKDENTTGRTEHPSYITNGGFRPHCKGGVVHGVNKKEVGGGGGVKMLETTTFLGLSGLICWQDTVEQAQVFGFQTWLLIYF